jgi:membrane associated rhomboid family serine protease
VDTVSAETHCYRHTRRETLLRCQRCDRYICTDCMREAPVGFRCPDCVKSENRAIRQARTVFGGKVSGRTMVTFALIALNVVAYVAELVHPGLVGRFDDSGTMLLGPDGEYYVDDGGPYDGYEQIGVLHGEWYRLITSAFLHSLPGSNAYGVLHIIFNMFWIWRLGRFLEERLGGARFLALYLVAALGGSALFVLLAPTSSAIGASGAGFGLAAAYYVLTRKLHEQAYDRNQILLYFVISMVLTAGSTAWQGHLGGLLAGGAAALGIAYAPRRHRGLWQAAALAGVALLCIVPVVALALR